MVGKIVEEPELESFKKPNTDEPKVEGFSLTGEELNNKDDKTFQIGSVPYYEEFDDSSDKTKKIRKLVIPVILSDGSEVLWYANKTSQKVIVGARGRALKEWVGYEGEFEVKEQKAFGEDRQVIYLVS